MNTMVRKSNPIGVTFRSIGYAARENDFRKGLFTLASAKVLGAAYQAIEYAGWDNLNSAKDYFLSKGAAWKTGLPDVNPGDVGEQLLYGTAGVIITLGLEKFVRNIAWPFAKSIPSIFGRARRASNAKLVKRKADYAERLRGPAENAGRAYEEAARAAQETAIQ